MATKRKKELDVFVTLQQYEALKSEFSACKRKLKSKEEAVKILHRELELCQEEKEEFARLMNHMKDYYLEGQTYLLSPVSTVDDELVDFQDESVDLSVKVVQLEALVKKMKLKHKEDVQTLRDKLSQARGALSPAVAPSLDLSEERSRLISQLESTQSQVMSLERQIQSLEDEKEEAMTERDYFAGKCATFTKMSEDTPLTSQQPSRTTMEKLMDENRQLKLELLEVQADRDSALNKIDRFKRAVDRRKTRDTQSQSIQFMNSDKLASLRQSVKRVQELESLANSLSEEVKEKTLAMNHLRNTNRLLGARIAELEHRLKVLEISGLWSTPDDDEEHKNDTTWSIQETEDDNLEQLSMGDNTTEPIIIT